MKKIVVLMMATLLAGSMSVTAFAAHTGVPGNNNYIHNGAVGNFHGNRNFHGNLHGNYHGNYRHYSHFRGGPGYYGYDDGDDFGGIIGPAIVGGLLGGIIGGNF